MNRRWLGLALWNTLLQIVMRKNVWNRTEDYFRNPNVSVTRHHATLYHTYLLLTSNFIVSRLSVIVLFSVKINVAGNNYQNKNFTIKPHYVTYLHIVIRSFKRELTHYLYFIFIILKTITIKYLLRIPSRENLLVCLSL